MTERRTFPRASLIEAERLARLKQVNARAAGRTHRALRADPVAATIDGYLGEWAVADSLGVPRLALVDGPDPGYDVRGPRGATIAVRYSRRLWGHLMCLAEHPFVTDAVVLVAGTGAPLTVKIVGGLPTAEFYAVALRGDFGHGPTDYVPQAHLIPWVDLKGTL